MYVTIHHLYAFLRLSEDLTPYRPVSPLLHFSGDFNITNFRLFWALYSTTNRTDFYTP
jgi:hypothetical protein